MNIGCHVSIAEGIYVAPRRAHYLGCEIMQIFTRSPQGGKASDLTVEIVEKFKKEKEKNKIKEVYIHTPYYINFASSNNRIRYGSVNVVRDELERGSLLGAKYAMTHIGSAKELGKKGAIGKIIEMLRKSMKGYKGRTKLLLENSAGAGEIIGDNLGELSEIIKGVSNDNIAGICLDTQHSFASGYDWRNFEEIIKKVKKEIGLEKIKLIHANDSQSECGSHKDRHEHIGKGDIGEDSFRKIVEFAVENNIDMICETKIPGVEKDIALLKKLRNKK